VTSTRLFLAIGLAALAAGAGLWHWTRQPKAPSAPNSIAAPSIAPAALFAATFVDESRTRRSLGQFQGRTLVINFWATWCGPCRAEMPAFERLHQRWGGRGVRFVGLSGEAPEVAARFGKQLGISYPLWTGGDDVQELSKRLGNRLSVLPHTVIVGPTGEVLEQRVGPYTEAELEARLVNLATKSS
jgi:thiol-disulfide isomerase/thioredoxin